MRRILGGSVAGLMTLALAGCGIDTPTQQDDRLAVDAPLYAAQGSDVVASASGGVRYTLGGLDLDGDGVEDPIHQRLVFTAQKDSDGAVKGEILYVQEVFGESFRFKGDVSCINVYDGNRVKFGGPVTQSADPSVPVGIFMWFHSIDNGQSAAAPPDQTTGLGIGDNDANEAFCDSDAPPNPQFLSDVTAGNLKVNG